MGSPAGMVFHCPADGGLEKTPLCSSPVPGSALFGIEWLLQGEPDGPGFRRFTGHETPMGGLRDGRRE